jgi:hypothetical protein
MRSYTCTSGLHSNELIAAYGDWLNGMPWGFYCTLTTRYSMSIRSARRAAERLHSHLTKKLGGIRLFWVAEPFDTKYGYHIHALVHFVNPILHNAIGLIKKAWLVVTKGKGGKEYNNTVIEPYQSELGANFYVSKYMLRYNSDYDICLPSTNAFKGRC